MASNNYCEYFNVNETYFPCIDESAINAGVDWQATYPHDTFIELLDSAEKMLGGATKRSLWVHGAYGTGKSQCVYTLKKILDAPEEEVREYWDKYDNLRKNKSLLEKILGHKKHGIITAFRYASGSINTPEQLFYAVQESIRDSLNAIPGSYKGENTLKESVIDWLTETAHNNFINELLQKPEWMAEFSQSTADEIINTLKKSSDVTGLMDSIFKLASKEGITALSLTSDSLCEWIRDVVINNNTKIVLIWDEFSGFFRQNRNSLDEFQKIVSLCQEINFYFVIVTHPITSITGAALSKDDPMSVVQQRFNKVEITLPSNIAFELTGHAFSVIPAAKSQWETMTKGLSGLVQNSTMAVMKATEVNDENIMRRMLPIHPMAALILKNIASAFQSNQRSMFDFIKTPKDLDVHAFQWFIQNSGPLSERPFLTIDMLWDFFYEKGKDYLSSDIKLILDTFPQQSNLTEKEEVVLKTILIMQAVDQRLGGSVPLLKPTDQNLSYAFEGDKDEYENSCKNIAKALTTKGVLIQVPIANGNKVYAAAVLAGDNAKIDRYKEDIRKNATTSKLIEEGSQLAISLSLPPALRLRFGINESGALPIVTNTNFIKTMDSLKTKDRDWHFNAVLALAKTDEEAQTFRNLIKKTIGDKQYENIIIIDALSTPLGLEEFEKYVDFSAMSMYYNGNMNQQSKDNARKAKDVLDKDWRDRIHDGQFIVWTYKNQDGEKATGAVAVQTILQTIVLNRFKYIPDFTKGLTESQLKLTQAKSSAKCGIDGQTKGVIIGCEKSVLGKVWGKDNYWEAPSTENESISIIKRDIDSLIKKSFVTSGSISIDEIYDYLEHTYGYAPCNITAFVVGFLLKEYSAEPYRCQDSDGHMETMTADKLSEMIGNYMSKKSKPTYIVNLTPAEKAFYDLTEDVWNLAPNSCTSPIQAGIAIQTKMHEFGYPIWTLKEMDNTGVYDIINKYIILIQNDGKDVHNTAIEIGEIAEERPSIKQDLKDLLTAENCQKGMELFLEHFENGRLLSLANEIGAQDHLLSDIKKLFSVKHAAQWIESTGEDELRKLITEYEFVKTTNILLNVSDSTKEGAYKSWRETLKFIGFSCEALQAKYPSVNKLFGILLEIANNEDLLPDKLKQLLEELTTHNSEMRDILSDPVAVFSAIYAPYLSDFDKAECEDVKNSITEDMFVLSETKSNAIVKKAAEDYRKNQVKTQLFKLWSDKTCGTKNPKQWSDKYETPILCCIDNDDYSEAKIAFGVLNGSSQSESDIKAALNFLENATFFDDIRDANYRDECFMKRIVGYYEKMLPDINEIRYSLEKTSIDAYEWIDNPKVKEEIKYMATAEYKAGKSDEVIDKIDSMNEDELKKWLKELVNKDMELGIRILADGGQ